MSNYKAEITLIIAVLIVFGAFVAFATGVFEPMLTKIGSGFTKMVNSVFSGAGMPK